MDNIRDLAGWISRLSWRNGGRDAIGYRAKGDVDREDGLAMGRSTTQPPLVGTAGKGYAKNAFGHDSMPQTGANTPALVSRSSWRANEFAGAGAWREGSAQTAAGKAAGSGGCKVVVWRSADGWCGRGNTVAGWVEMNRAVSCRTPAQLSHD